MAYKEKINIDINTRSECAYKFLKKEFGLVSIGYARKVLKVGKKGFENLKEKYGLQEYQIPAPVFVSFKTKLYKLSDIYHIKDQELNESEK